MIPLRFLTPLLALALAACGQQDTTERAANGAEPDPSQAAAPAPDLPTLSGQVSAGEVSQLPRGISLRVRLVDVTDPATPPVTVAERQLETRRLPADFELPYDPANIEEGRRYVAQAELVTEGVTLYSTIAPVPVLTQGAGTRADLVLTRGAGPDTTISVAEQYRRDFDLLESQLGNMRRVVGERMTDDVTVGWDAFVDDTGVRFARESVDFADGGRASFRYAYRYGKPWIVARERGGTTVWVGWDNDGELVLNQRNGEGVSAEEAGQLRERAAEMLRIAGQRAGSAR